MINSKISPYEKSGYTEIFNKLLLGIAGKNILKGSPERKTRGLLDEPHLYNLWLEAMKAIDGIDETYGKPKIVMSYLLKKAQVKFHEIELFCKKESLESLDVVRVVRII